MKKTLKSFRLSAFADVGNVYGTDEDFEADLLRYSVGVGAIWISPLEQYLLVWRNHLMTNRLMRQKTSNSH